MRKRPGRINKSRSSVLYKASSPIPLLPPPSVYKHPDFEFHHHHLLLLLCLAHQSLSSFPFPFLCAILPCSASVRPSLFRQIRRSSSPDPPGDGHLRAVPEVHHWHLPHRDAGRARLQRGRQPRARHPGPCSVRQVHD